MAAAGLLEAEIVTADGAVRMVNACTDPDLFWAIKGGGGGSLGVLTKLTLRTRELPVWFGAAFLTVKAASDAAFRRLIGQYIDFYSARLCNPHWGESVTLRPDNTLAVSAGVARFRQRSGRGRLATIPRMDCRLAAGSELCVGAADQKPSRRSDGGLPIGGGSTCHIRSTATAVGRACTPYLVGRQPSRGRGSSGTATIRLAARSLLQADRQQQLADALFAGSRHWPVSLHFNKGLAGAPAEAIASARDTAINPAVLDAFALAIIAGGGPPAYPGIPGHQPDLTWPQTRRRDRQRNGRAAQAGARGWILRVGERFFRANPGSKRSGGRITRGCGRSKRNTIRAAFSSYTTAWAAKSGARMASPG